MTSLTQTSALIAFLIMGAQLIVLLYGGFVFFSKLSVVIKDVDAMKKEVNELPTFSQHYKISSEQNTKDITAILKVVAEIPNLQQRMLTAELYMRENGSLKADLSVVIERTNNLVSLLEAIKATMCTISNRQWDGIERELGSKKVT